MTALFVRLAGLGFVDEALAEARSTWGQPMPAEAAVSLISAAPEADRNQLLGEALASARERGDGVDLISALASLVRQLAEPGRAQASEMLSTAIEGLERRQSASEIASVALDLSMLPSQQRLLLWQKALQFASVGIRRDMLSDLPKLLTLVEDMAGQDLWPQVADSLGTIRQWWP